jgi:signal transduction histidine kinase
MSRLIDDVLDFSRGRLGGGIPITRERVENVEEVVNHVVAEVASAHPERTLRVAYQDGWAQDGGAAYLDRTRITQLLSNLVGNAVEHSPPGEPVDILVDGTEALIRFAVTNRGEPIPADVMPRIFKPYFRGEVDPQGSSLGLGLYIVAEIARSHGGFVQVSSTKETGTTFTVALPRSKPS